MAERVVTLRMRVEDGEVVAATGSVNRLKAAANNPGGGPQALKQIETGAQNVDRATAKAAQRLGISYDQMIAKIKAASSASQSSSAVMSAIDKKRIAEAHSRGIAVEKAQKAEQNLAAASAQAAEGLGAFLTKAGLVGIAIAAIVVATAAAVLITASLTQKVFDLSQEYADYALKVGKASEANGLMTETVSALMLQAERTGTSFSDLQSPIDNFRKTIGQAAAGSEDARAKLLRLGIDALTAGQNIDGAFRSAVAAIVTARDPVQQTSLAFAAFGEEGYKLLPFFRSFNGDVPAAVREAEKLGIVIGRTNVKAAKEFNAAYTDLQKAIQGLTDLFGKEFLPMVTKVFRDFTGWLTTNKEDVKGWATWTASWVQVAIDRWTAFFELVRKSKDASQSYDLVFAPDGTQIPVPKAVPKGPDGGAPVPNTFGGVKTTVPGMPGVQDPAVLEAARKEFEKRLQETIERAKRDWDAAIQSWENYGSEAEKTLSRVFKQLQDRFAESGNAEEFRANVRATNQWYLTEIEKAYSALETLEDKKDQRNNATQNEIDLRAQQQLVRRRDFGNKAADIEKQTEDLIKKASEKASADVIQAMRARIERLNELDASRTETYLENLRKQFQDGQITERQFIDISNTQAEGDLQNRLKRAEEYLARVKGNKAEEAEAEQKVALIKQEIDRQNTRSTMQLTQAEERRKAVLDAIRALERENRNPAAVDQRRKDLGNDQKSSLMAEITQLQDLIANGGINDQLIVQAELLRTILELRNQELNATISIQKSQLLLSRSMQISGNQIRAQVYEHLASQRTLNDAIADGITQTYDALGAKLDEQIDKMFEWAGAFKSLFTEPLKALQRNALTNITTGLLDAIAPGLGQQFQDATANPIAKPIVQKLDKTNQLLNLILGRLGGGSSLSSLGGLTSLLSGGGLSGGFGSGGGFGGTPAFGGGSGLPTITLPNGEQAVQVDGRSILQKITGPGGVFGREGFGNNVGTYGAIGAAGNLVGSAIGGRFGSALSGAASGLSIGASIGSIIPGVGTAIGAVVGAAAGFLAGLFGFSDPKRKKDKQENIPALNDGFSKAFKELNDILAGIRSLSIDPDEAVARAGQVRAEIAGGFGIQFLSKKYRKQAQTMISSNLVRADGLIAQITAAAGIARGAADRSQRILPEFAGGNYFADYFRPNGLIPGAFDGADNILAMISRGEMVINPMQQGRVRALAGFDVFAGAGIPNYPRASSSPKLATGGIAGVGLAPAASQNITMQPNFTLVLEGVAMDDRIAAYLESDSGLRTQIRVRKKAKDRGNIT